MAMRPLLPLLLFGRRGGKARYAHERELHVRDYGGGPCHRLHRRPLGPHCVEAFDALQRRFFLLRGPVVGAGYVKEPILSGTSESQRRKESRRCRRQKKKKIESERGRAAE